MKGVPDPPHAIDTLVERALADGVARYGQLDVSRHELLEHLRAAIRRSGAPGPSLVLADLYVACAIESGRPGGWQALLHTHRPALVRMLTARGFDTTLATDVVDSLPGALVLQHADGHRTALGSYDGRGSLRSWLGVHACRSATRDRLARTDGVPASESTSCQPTPNLEAATRECARSIAKALREAWQELPPRSRIALALRHVHGASCAEIARVLGVGMPRVSRIVDAAIQHLRRHLSAHPDVDSGRGVTKGVLELLAAEVANLADPHPPSSHGGDPSAAPR